MFDFGGFLKQKLDELLRVQGPENKPAPAQTVTKPQGPQYNYNFGTKQYTPINQAQNNNQQKPFQTGVRSFTVPPVPSMPKPQVEPKQSGPTINDAGNFLFGGTAKLANSGLGVAEKFGVNVAGEAQKLFGDQAGGQRTIDEGQRSINDRLLKKGSGLFGAGGIYNSLEEQSKADPWDVAKRAGGAGLQSASEILPVGRGLQVAKSSSPLVSKILTGGVQGAAAGALGSTGSQLLEKGSVDPLETAKGTGVGALLGGAIPGVSGGAQRLLQRGRERATAPVAPPQTPEPTQLPATPDLTPSPQPSRRYAPEPVEPPRSVPPYVEPARTEGQPAPSTLPELPTTAANKVGLMDKAFRSTRSVIERQGESGQRLAEGLRNARDTQELYLGQLEKSIPTITKLARPKAIGRNSWTNKDFENFVDSVEGKASPHTPEVSQAVNEWRATAPTIRERAVNSGLDVGDLGPNYYPHFIDYDQVFKDKNTYNQSINHLVESGQAKTPEEAIKLLSYARDTSRNREFGNLEASRVVDLPFYDKTPNSLVNYLNSATKRISNTETFGSGDEKALKLIAGIGREGGDTEAAKNAFDIAVGARKYNPTSENVSRGIRKYITTTRLGLGALTNVSQNVNTGIVTGHLRTLGAMAKQLSPKTREFVQDTGVISDTLLNDLKTQYGYESFTSKVFGKAVNKVTAPFFGNVEKFNRAVAATAGRDYALRLAQKGDEATLRKLRVKGTIEGKTLTEEQQVQAARSIVEKTQFKVDPQDLPGWADSPGGKLVSQFRTFSYNQGKFFSNEILKPAAKGNLLPLSRMLAALPLGYALYETRRTIDGRPEEEDKVKVGLQSFSKIGGAGLALDIYQSMNPVGSKYLPSDRRVSMAVGAFGGPAAGLVAQAVGSASEAIQQKSVPKDESDLQGKVAIKSQSGEGYNDLTPLSRFGIQQMPIVGTATANRVLPYKQSSDGETKKSEASGGSMSDAIKSVNKESKDATAELKKSVGSDAYEVSQLTDAEKKKLIDRKVLTSDQIKLAEDAVEQKKKDLGLSEGRKIDTKLPASTPEYKVLLKLADLPDEEKDKWRAKSVEGDTKFLYDQANALRPKGAPDFPSTNEVAEIYAKYRKDIEDSLDQTQVQKNKGLKEFVKKAYDSSLTDGQKALASLSSADLRAEIEAGNTTKEDLDNIIKLDDIRHALGFSTNFSNKDRKALGYNALPSKSSGGSKKGSRGGKKSSKGKFDYKLFGFNSAGASNSKQLYDLLKKAKVTNSKKTKNSV